MKSQSKSFRFFFVDENIEDGGVLSFFVLAALKVMFKLLIFTLWFFFFFFKDDQSLDEDYKVSVRFRISLRRLL